MYKLLREFLEIEEQHYKHQTQMRHVLWLILAAVVSAVSPD
jgi:hypothetical protein